MPGTESDLDLTLDLRDCLKGNEVIIAHISNDEGEACCADALVHCTRSLFPPLRFNPSLFAPAVAVENLASPLNAADEAQQHDEKRAERILQAEAKHKSTPGVEGQKSEEVRVCIYGSPFHVTLK